MYSLRSAYYPRNLEYPIYKIQFAKCMKLKKNEDQNVDTLPWNMARKLKIMKNKKNPLDHLKNDQITENRDTCEMHTVGPGIWREN